ASLTGVDVDTVTTSVVITSATVRRRVGSWGPAIRSGASTCGQPVPRCAERHLMLRLVSDSADVIEGPTNERVLARDEVLDSIVRWRLAGCAHCDGHATVLGCMICPARAHPSSGSQPGLGAGITLRWLVTRSTPGAAAAALVAACSSASEETLPVSVATGPSTST